MLFIVHKSSSTKDCANSPTEREIQCYFFIGFYERGNAQNKITKVEIQISKELRVILLISYRNLGLNII